jgi:hypothetical protein
MKKQVAIAGVITLCLVGTITGTLLGTAPTRAALSSTTSSIAITPQEAQQIALKRAIGAGDSSPTISVTSDSLGNAVAAMQDSPGSAPVEPETPVYLVTMRGNFVLGLAHVPKGHKTPTGNILQVVVSYSGFVLGLHLGSE